MRRGTKVIYKSHHGQRYSAIVQRVHNDGDLTIQVYFELDEHGREDGCYQGDRFRVGSMHLERWS